MCSREVRLNFDFKGFSVHGKVVSSGHSDGPNGVKMTLEGPHDLNLETVTGDKGVYSFDKISPGKYSLKAHHPDMAFENDQFTFETVNKNINVEDKVSVCNGNAEKCYKSVLSLRIIVFADTSKRIRRYWLCEQRLKASGGCLHNPVWQNWF